MDQLFQCLIVWISLTQIPQKHENISNPKITIEMFIFLDSNQPIPNPTNTWKHIKPQSNNWNVHILDSNHPSPNPTKTYKNPKAPKKPPNHKHSTPWYPNSQQPTLKNTNNTQQPRHPNEIEDITYILHPFHSSPLILYYASITSKISK
jgi:hypothetical protein